MTIVALELALVAFDYLLFLFAPLIKHLMQRLGLKKHTPNGIAATGEQCNLHQWLAMRKHIKQEPSGYKRKSDKQLSLSDRLDEEVRDFFQWQQEEIEASLDERTALLRRTQGLIEAKWPWVSCHPTLIDPVGRQLNCWSYDLCLMADWDFPALLPAVGASLVPNKEDKNGGEKSEQMKIVYSNPFEQKFLLQVESPLVSLDSYAGRLRRLSVESNKTSERQTKTLCVRWSTREEFNTEADRSSVIFYYTQTMPDLAPLYSILVEFLVGAQLLETSDGRCPSGPEDGDEKVGQPRRVTRYQLLLMLVAYLQQSDSKLSLSAKLIGFLDTYARLSDTKSIRIGPASGRRLRIDLVDRERADLRILDPASKSEKEMCVGMTLSLGKLFTQLSLHMKHVVEPADGLQSLFELALNFARLKESKQRGEERAKPIEEEDDKSHRPLLRKQPSSDSTDSLAATRATKKATKIDTNPLAWDSSILKGFWAQLKWRKILTNALYVMLLLLVRNLMLNYLQNLQHDLQAEASDDLVQFRKIIFDSSHSQANQRKQQQMKKGKREPEDPILEDEDQVSAAAADSGELKQATSGQTASLGGGDFGMDGLMESMMQQMFANLAGPGADAGGAGPGPGLQSEEVKRLMELMREDGEEWGEEEAAKMAEVKQLLEKITGRPISDEELNQDISEEDLARKMESLNLSALGFGGMEDESDEFGGLEGGDNDYDEEEEDDEELPSMDSNASPVISQVKDEL